MEVLVRVVDKGAALDCSKRGDVIAICPDGWAWSPAELTNPDWRIVRVPILQTTADALLTTPQPTGGPQVQRRREYYVDFSQLPDPSLFSGARTVAIIELTRQQVSKAVVRKP